MATPMSFTFRKKQVYPVHFHCLSLRVFSHLLCLVCLNEIGFVFPHRCSLSNVKSVTGIFVFDGHSQQLYSGRLLSFNHPNRSESED